MEANKRQRGFQVVIDGRGQYSDPQGPVPSLDKALVSGSWPAGADQPSADVQAFNGARQQQDRQGGHCPRVSAWRPSRNG